LRYDSLNFDRRHRSAHRRNEEQTR
jgi:hypothetical protein